MPVFNALTDGPDLVSAQSNWEQCAVSVFLTVAGKWAESALKGLGVTYTREVIKEHVGRWITWANLRSVLNKRTFSTAVDLFLEMTQQLLDLAYSGFKSALEELIEQLPPEPDPKRDPDQLTNTVTVSVTGPGRVRSLPAGITCPGMCTAPFPVATTVTLSAEANSGAVFSSWGGTCTGSSSTCSVPMNTSASVTATFTSRPSSQTWDGSFTAKGTFQLSSSCTWRFVEDFSEVRLTVRADGTGTLSAKTRTTEGPRISGPSSCPDNTYVREQYDLFQLNATPTGGGWHFELVGQQTAIRSLQGTASSTGASGTYRLKTGALGAGGIRESSADFSLRPSR